MRLRTKLFLARISDYSIWSKDRSQIAALHLPVILREVLRLPCGKGFRLAARYKLERRQHGEINRRWAAKHGVRRWIGETIPYVDGELIGKVHRGFFGRPPFLPFSARAACCAWVFFEPPLAPMCFSHAFGGFMRANLSRSKNSSRFILQQETRAALVCPVKEAIPPDSPLRPMKNLIAQFAGSERGTPALLSVVEYSPAEAGEITGDDSCEEGQTVVECHWVDGVSGWYVNNGKTLCATVANESEEFTGATACHEWLYNRCKGL